MSERARQSAAMIVSCSTKILLLHSILWLVRMTRLNNQRPFDGAGHLSISFDDGSYYSNRGLFDC